MKSAGIILMAAYLVVLASMPCSDHEIVSHDVENGCGAVAVWQESGQDNGHTDPIEDLCSPLCGCHCCSIAVDEPAAAPVWGLLIPPLNVRPFSRETLPFFSVSVKIWRPPASA